MTSVSLPTPRIRRDGYGHARMPRRQQAPEPQHIDRVEYGRFRNLYVYITNACNYRCKHCYMGERLDEALKMPYDQVLSTLETWRRLGSSKVTILGGEPTLHPDYVRIIRAAGTIGFEDVITTTNAHAKSMRKFDQLEPSDFAYVQVSLDGGSAESHDRIRGEGTFEHALASTRALTARGFDVRIICTVNNANQHDAMGLMDIADDIGVSLVKYHVFSTIGVGHDHTELAMSPPEWVDFCDKLNAEAPRANARVWYQPTYARRSDMERYATEGYNGCIGRTLDRASVFPDGKVYVCSYLFDTDLHFAEMRDGQVVLNRGPAGNEFDLFTLPLTESACGGCKASACLGGCPAEKVVMGASSCETYPDIVPVCRLWKSSAKSEE
ncbi:radical SAM/SPASM domain-containing protein [Nocardia sp. CA-128927]|uniref:radical SAM protein n=1 Tax=Nocardia sp. CA-128927 TaxID=3239975 RepID=UPI003D9952D1